MPDEELEELKRIANEGGPQQVVVTARSEPIPPLFVFVLVASLLCNGFMTAAWWTTQERMRESIDRCENLLAYVVTLRESLIKAGFQPPPMEKEDAPRHPDAD